MDKNQMIPSEITSAIAQAANPNILVNQGDGIQILQNHGPININVSGPELIGLLSMLGAKPADNPVTHTMEWASLSRTHYCLFVLENEEYKDGVFSIAKDRALQKYTPKDVRDKYRMLNPANMDELRKMPCIFTKRNMYYKRTEPHHPALVGRISNAVPQGEVIKIYFSGFQAFSQQILNQNTTLLHMASAPLRNELDVEHWAIKECNLIDAFVAMNIEIK